MRYLVTGGAGFIGSHFCDYLVGRGHAVCALDDLSTGCRRNVCHLMGHARFELAVGSVLDRPTLRRLMAGCDRVVHLAAVVGVKRVLERPVETVITNVEGTENVLDLASRCGRKTFVASSSEVYGRAMEGRAPAAKLREDDAWVLGPASGRRWAYACSKAAGELLAKAYHEERGLPVVVARFFNVVGPRQSGCYGMVLPTFVEQALRAEPIRVFGSGAQTRCFAHVADAVRAAHALMNTPEAVGEVFNVGSDEETSINALARHVRRLAGSPSDVVHVSYEEAYGDGFEDVQRRVPDLSRLRAAIGYEPEYDLQGILRAVIAFFRQEEAAGAL